MKTLSSVAFLSSLLVLAASPVAIPWQSFRNPLAPGSTLQWGTGHPWPHATGSGYSTGARPTATAPLNSYSTSVESISSPASTSSAPSSGSNASSSLTVHSGCLQKNNIPVGWLPDEDTSQEMTAITNELGAKARFYGLYSQITSTTYDDSQLTSRMPDIQKSCAVLIASIMPTGVKFVDIDSDLGAQLAT
ncbi:hypothetical protein MMC20_003146 [Loxospora ochrophaea]|nr:hypothetical protein [Loxospora ochrophaea]